MKQQLNAIVILIVAKQFIPFVQEHGLKAEISRGDMPTLLMTSDEGRKLKKAGVMEAMSLSKSFFKLILTDLFEDTLAACAQWKPDLLILTTFPYFAGCSAIPGLLASQCKVMIAHTIPSSPTTEFCPPTVGGFTSRFGFMNSLYWSLGESVAFGKIYAPLVQEMWNTKGIKLVASKELGFSAPREHGQRICYIYSKALLPKPSDWTENEVVTGFLEMQDEPFTPPADLQSFLQNSKGPIVYVGLGSMLGFMFDSVQEQTEVLDKFVEGYNLLAQKRQVRMILHCVEPVPITVNPVPKESVYMLKTPVPHSWLFPQCDLIVHHGGAGSTQTSLLYGKPTLILPCGAQSDQPFWGDLLTSKHLGPKSKLLSKLTPAKFASKVEDGLFINSNEYKVNAGKMGKAMRDEHGVDKFVDVCKDVLMGKV